MEGRYPATRCRANGKEARKEGRNETETSQKATEEEDSEEGSEERRVIFDVFILIHNYSPSPIPGFPRPG